MKLAISNLAFPSSLQAAEWAALSSSGVEGIEVAPTRLGEWETLSEARMEQFRQQLAEHRLVVSSLQAILFGVPGVQLLAGDTEFQTLKSHMHRVGSIAAALGAGVAVFGAPKQRSKGELSDDDAFKLGVDRFRVLADVCAQYDVVIGLEPVPAAYAGDFLPTWQDVARMVDEVQSPHLRVHLDTACVLLGGGDIAAAIAETSKSLAHFHIAEPKLTNFTNPVSEHAAAAKALAETGYEGWLSIEMMEDPDKAFECALSAVEFARRTYSTEKPAPS
jgi:sugar phosphate isomerase/epimerase